MSTDEDFFSNRKDSHKSLKRLISPFNDEWDSDSISIQSSNTEDQDQNLEVEGCDGFVVPAVQFQINQNPENNINNLQSKSTGIYLITLLFYFVQIIVAIGLGPRLDQSIVAVL